MLEIYFYKYKALSNVKKRKLGNKNDSINLFLEAYNYDIWFSYMPPLEGKEEEVKERKGFKILTLNKLLTSWKQKKLKTIHTN